LDRAILNRLAQALPDVPRWVETRSMLLSGRCEVFGLKEEEDLDFVVRDAEDVLISVVGHPGRDAIEEAAAREWEGDVVIAAPESGSHVAAALPGWRAVSATQHLLGDAPRLPRVPEGAVRWLEESELEMVDGLPPDLLSELRLAARRSSIAAGLDGGRPVSFCYAAAQTEGLWDISIDTLEEYRNQGHAGRCVAYMVEHMREKGKQPVWGADEWNRASLGLAAKLGFVPVNELIVFHPARSRAKAALR
jgi:RimJ/RimL family protein N-acetyltransferase